MDSVYKEIQKGSFYLFLSKYSNIVVQLIITSFLARLISPEDFGVITISMVFILFFSQFSDIGFGVSIVQSKELKLLDVDSFFVVTFVQGVVFTLLFVLSVPYITTFYGIEKLKDILLILSVSILFYCINTVPNALNRKDKKFKLIGIVTVLTNLLTGIFAILMAYFADAAIYALVYKIILDGIIIFILNLKVSRYRPRFRFSIEPIKRDLKYTSFQFLYSTIYYFSRNLDNMIIGKFLGASPLGFYDKAYKLMIMPVQNLSNVISPVLHPVLSDINHDNSNIAKVYLNLIKLLALIGFPLSIYLFFVADEVILLLYGTGWEQSVEPFKFLALSVGFQMIISSSRGVFQAVGKTKQMFVASLISVVMIVCSLYITMVYFDTITAVSVGISLAYFLTFASTFYILISKVLGTDFIKFLKIFINPLVISVFIYASLFFEIIDTDYLVLNFILKSILAFSIYVLTSFLIKEKFILAVLKKVIYNFRN